MCTLTTVMKQARAVDRHIVYFTNGSPQNETTRTIIIYSEVINLEEKLVFVLICFAVLFGLPTELGIISVSRHPNRSNQDLSSEPKAGDNVTVAERA